MASEEPLLNKLRQMAQRLDALQADLNDPAVLSNPAKLVPISREAGQLEPMVTRFRAYLATLDTAAELKKMIDHEPDPDMVEMAQAELEDAHLKAGTLLENLKDDLLAAEDNAVDSFFLEIRAGTGGEEAALFARGLYEMYNAFCQTRGWKFEVSDFSVAEHGGFKEVIAHVKGSGSWRHMQFEGGGHRVQRVPETETQGRIHTSLATVAVLPEMADVKIDINPRDVEECGCRGGGPGGQNVNKVETGWQLNHKPSGLRFKMTEYKSQAQNKERAWALLRATLYEAERAKQHAVQTSARKSMMGSGDRSQRIRTYNFPQNRCTDHRLGGEGGGEKNFNLEQVFAGQMDELINALLELDKQQRLAAL